MLDKDTRLTIKAQEAILSLDWRGHYKIALLINQSQSWIKLNIGEPDIIWSHPDVMDMIEELTKIKRTEIIEKPKK